MTKTEKKILEAAARILRYDLSASFEAIAQAAGVSRRTMYRYFPNKENLLDHLILDYSKECKKRIQKIDAENKGHFYAMRKMLENDIDDGMMSGLMLFFNKQCKMISGEGTSESTLESNDFVQLEQFFFNRLNDLREKKLFKLDIPNEAFVYIMLGIIFGASRAIEEGVVARKKMYDLVWQVLTEGILDDAESKETK